MEEMTKEEGKAERTEMELEMERTVRERMEREKTWRKS